MSKIIVRTIKIITLIWLVIWSLNHYKTDHTSIISWIFVYLPLALGYEEIIGIIAKKVIGEKKPKPPSDTAYFNIPCPSCGTATDSESLENWGICGSCMRSKSDSYP